MKQRMKQSLSVLHQIVTISRLPSDQWTNVHRMRRVAEILHMCIQIGNGAVYILIMLMQDHRNEIERGMMGVRSKITGFINEYT